MEAHAFMSFIPFGVGGRDLKDVQHELLSLELSF
jgi:hypothetical protein